MQIVMKSSTACGTKWLDKWKVLALKRLYEYDVEKHQVEIDAKKAVSMD